MLRGISAALRSNSLAPRGERVRVRDICAARLSVAPHIRNLQQLWSLTPRSKTSGGLSPQGARQGLASLRMTAMLIPMLAFAASCSQVHEKMFTLDCAIGRAPLAGELAPGTAMALDVSTSPIPLLFPPHRAIARCDSAGVVTMDIETPIDTGLSQLSTPLSTAASHITYVP